MNYILKGKCMIILLMASMTLYEIFRKEQVLEELKTKFYLVVLKAIAFQVSILILLRA